MSFLTGNTNISSSYSSLTNGTTGTSGNGCMMDGITSGTTGTIATPLVYSDYNTNYNPYGELRTPISNSNSFTSLNFNSINMAQLRQSKIAIFEVTRDKKTNEIKSSEFLLEVWVEIKPGISLDLVAAKHLNGDYNPETIVVKEVQSVYF
jgi:hypothetical protein